MTEQTEQQIQNCLVLIRCMPVQVNAAFDNHVDDCNVEGFMHALGYSAFKAEGGPLWSDCYAWSGIARRMPL